MTHARIEDICAALSECFAAQERAVAEWHKAEPAFPGDGPAPGLEGLAGLVLRQHWANFGLWHVEDRARRRDVGPEVIAECKQAIDRLNQERNDLIERIDARLVECLTPLLPPDARDRRNTETVGSALDRMSILALKLFHMDEQVRRVNVDEEHRRECRRKHTVLAGQRAELGRAILELVGEFAAGLKCPQVYYQFKMYNDPRLNPELYGAGGGRRG
jgi:hypothetical protein